MDPSPSHGTPTKTFPKGDHTTRSHDEPENGSFVIVFLVEARRDPCSPSDHQHCTRRSRSTRVYFRRTYNIPEQYIVSVATLSAFRVRWPARVRSTNLVRRCATDNAVRSYFSIIPFNSRLSPQTSFMIIYRNEIYISNNWKHAANCCRDIFDKN